MNDMPPTEQKIENGNGNRAQSGNVPDSYSRSTWLSLIVWMIRN
jgi:hypothetical protein